MGKEKRVIDGKEVEVNVEMVDGKEVVTPIKAVSKEVSQDAIDRIFKQFKTAEERAEKLEDLYKQSEISKTDLVERIKLLEEQNRKPSEIEDRPKTYGQQPNGSILYPQTEEEWDDLIAERPAFGTDLRAEYNKQTKGKTEDIRKAQKESALRVANDLLPDMYKRDSEGKVVLDKNGHPTPDEQSDTFKIYCQIASEEGVDSNGNPVIFSTKNGPELIALKVQRVLGTERETELKVKAENERLEREGNRGKKVKNGQIAPPGQQPPSPKQSVKVTFGSDWEKQRAESKVAQGVYKSLEEYCAIRDNQTIPYGRGNV